MESICDFIFLRSSKIVHEMKIFHYLIVFLEGEKLEPFVISMLISMKYAYIAEIKSITCSMTTTCRLHRPIISYYVQFSLNLGEYQGNLLCRYVKIHIS